ncbi:hypothetical protein B0T18DRAFT_399119, partial [Schizothecium vesticola]
MVSARIMTLMPPVVVFWARAHETHFETNGEKRAPFCNSFCRVIWNHLDSVTTDYRFAKSTLHHVLHGITDLENNMEVHHIPRNVPALDLEVPAPKTTKLQPAPPAAAHARAPVGVGPAHSTPPCCPAPAG